MKNGNKRVTSAFIVRKNTGSFNEDILTSKKHIELLVNERKNYTSSYEVRKKKNNFLISKFKTKNQELKNLREQLFLQKKHEVAKKKPSSAISDINAQAVQWRFKYNEMKDYVNRKQKQLLVLQDKLEEIDNMKNIAMEETPYHKQIRILENKLDKTIIKFNEAQNIKKMYELELKGLKEEKVSYDVEIEKIEKELKVKDDEFGQVKKMLRNALRAKNNAFNSLKTIDNKREDALKNYQKVPDETKKEIEMKMIKARQMQQSMHKIKQETLSKDSLEDADDQSEKENDVLGEAIELNEYYRYEFKRIMDVTGTKDSKLISQPNHPKVHHPGRDQRLPGGTGAEVQGKAQ